MSGGTSIEYSIDYLQYTIKDMPAFKPVDGVDAWRKSYMRMYERMRICQNGTHIHIGNPNSDKYLVVMSGTACTKVGVDKHYLANIVSCEANITRLDLAMTTNFNFLPLLMNDYKAIESNLWYGVKCIADAEYTPETIYIGDMKQRGKKGIVRAYNKGLQIGLDLDMFRLETEYRKKHAKIGAKRIASSETIPSVMNSKFYVKTEWYKKLLGSTVSTTRFKDITKVDEESPISKKMAWIMKSVLPSLQYVIDYDKVNGTNNFETIIESLNWSE